MASSDSRPAASTPSPSRVTLVRRSSSSTAPSATSPTRSRVELVPRSTTAIRCDATIGDRTLQTVLGISRHRGTTHPPERADAFADISLPNHEGEPVRLGDLWAKRPAVLVWLRHYG